MTLRVLVIDDSALVRQVLTELLDDAPDIEVVGVARDPFDAREKIKSLNPDVLTLDVEMPRMDGLTFLENLMRLRPMPVVMVSSLTERGADITLRALELGAIDFVTKPDVGVADGLRAYADTLCDKVREASLARPRQRTTGQRTREVTVARAYRTTDQLICIGSSTGGTEALRSVLERMPPDAPAVVMAQHIPVAFSESLARRLDGASAMRVCQARDGQQITPGHAYLAPGNQHLRVVRSGARLICRLGDDEPVNGHRPSVDVLFRSVTEACGRNAVGVMLTGMGADGASAMLELHQAGARTLAQDEATSVVWGMPGAAVRLGAVDRIVPIESIAQAALDASRQEIVA
ncbi:chemotaxis response regulator protein-glutamate methylesterase [uncultured Abyssibacter sp.]|uniref:protein-glutamate methylesterase/protein-glutamine glutaminase n=1 Tax=uncultured Abyssibacter sp. TaxID=2320202 RepID=UPI0032B0FC35